MWSHFSIHLKIERFPVSLSKETFIYVAAGGPIACRRPLGSYRPRHVTRSCQTSLSPRTASTARTARSAPRFFMRTLPQGLSLHRGCGSRVRGCLVPLPGQICPLPTQTPSTARNTRSTAGIFAWQGTQHPKKRFHHGLVNRGCSWRPALICRCALFSQVSFLLGLGLPSSPTSTDSPPNLPIDPLPGAPSPSWTPFLAR
jgi:hypothetical protein